MRHQSSQDSLLTELAAMSPFLYWLIIETYFKVFALGFIRTSQKTASASVQAPSYVLLFASPNGLESSGSQ